MGDEWMDYSWMGDKWLEVGRLRGWVTKGNASRSGFRMELPLLGLTDMYPDEVLQRCVVTSVLNSDRERAHLGDTQIGGGEIEEMVKTILDTKYPTYHQLVLGWKFIKLNMVS